jgi:anti-sigma regulatory factor (Ser/Thr protein kinase)
MHGVRSSATHSGTGGHVRQAGTAPAGQPGLSRARAGRPAAGMRVPSFTAHQPGSPGSGWDRNSYLELGALPGAVPSARLHARQVLWEWGLAGLADSTELLVSELVTNAVRASREATGAGSVRLWLLADTARVVIVVWDGSPQPPAPVDAGDDAESGRGLLLVDALSSGWGYYHPSESYGGKLVWAQVGPPTGVAGAVS